MAVIITTNGLCRDIHPANGIDFSLEEMRSIVGGNIELVELNEKKTMVINEEGKLISLPLNPSASRIFRAHRPSSGDFIVGDVLVCKTEQIL